MFAPGIGAYRMLHNTTAYRRSIRPHSPKYALRSLKFDCPLSIKFAGSISSFLLFSSRKCPVNLRYSRPLKGRGSFVRFYQRIMTLGMARSRAFSSALPVFPPLALARCSRRDASPRRSIRVRRDWTAGCYPVARRHPTAPTPNWRFPSRAAVFIRCFPASSRHSARNGRECPSFGAVRFQRGSCPTGSYALPFAIYRLAHARDR